VESICTYLAYGRPSTIAGNDPGCNTDQEISHACFLATNNPIERDPIYLFPNPTSGITEVHGIDISQSGINLSDMQGRKITNYETINNIIDLNLLPGGIYILSLEFNNLRIIKRIVKI